jgi:hypothetical protein
MADAVNHPSHYTTGKIEVIDFIEDQKLGFHEANAVKYIARAKHKGRELEDLQKARWYLDRKIQKLEEQCQSTGATDAAATVAAQFPIRAESGGSSGSESPAAAAEATECRSRQAGQTPA